MAEQIPWVGTRTSLRAPARRALYTGAPGLSMHADSSVDRSRTVAQVCADEGLGAVYQVRMKAASRVRRAADLVRVHESRGADLRHIMFDAARYSGKDRDSGVHDLSPDWLRVQHELGCRYALTDSPYIPEGDREALKSVLSQAAALSNDDVVACLPLHLDWMRTRSEELLELINRYEVPVGLVLEARDDPLARRPAVVGLIHVLSAQPKVVLLRSDLSAIGAVAFGASMGAIGTRSSLRHLYPSPAKGGRPAGISAFVPHSFAYRLLDTINNAIAKASDNPEWFTCDCAYCSGRSLSWIATAEEAYLHSMSAAAVVAQQIIGATDDPVQRKASWLARCRDAQTINLEINALLGGGWPAPEFLGGWHAACP